LQRRETGRRERTAGGKVFRRAGEEGAVAVNAIEEQRRTRKRL
jgi:hypothetical protein